MENITKFLVCGATLVLLSACGNDDKYSVHKPSKNKSPVAESMDITTQTDTTVSGQLTASDPDGDALQYSLASEPSNGTLSINSDGSFSYMPALEFTGTDQFTFSVSDGKNMSVSASVNITVETLQLSFAEYSRDVFSKDVNAMPASVNGRVFNNDVNTTEFYQDLVDLNN